MESENYYHLGYIARAHGLKGEVKIIFQEPVKTQSIRLLYIEINNQVVPYKVSSISDRVNKIFVQLEGVHSREEAQKLTGCRFMIDKDKCHEVVLHYEENYAYTLGYVVIDEALGDIGTVVQLKNLKHSPYLIVAGVQTQNKEIWIPVNSPFIKECHRQKRCIQVTLPDGYLEL